MNLDHHNGKAVKKISKHKITFEDDTVVTIEGEIPAEVKGETLLAVEGDAHPILVFGHGQPGEVAVRVVEVPVEAPETPSEAS